MALLDLRELADSQGSVNATEISLFASAAGSAAVLHRLHRQEQGVDEPEL